MRYVGLLIGAVVLVLGLGSPVALGEPAGTFRAAIEPIVQVDPAFISSDAEVAVASHVYDYLVDIDGQNRIVPRLARSWEVSEDGLTYTFRLHEGVTFHDGTPLSAADVVWTFDRLRDPDLGFATVDLYENIMAIDATGDMEVRFTLSRPNPFFLYDLTDNRALVIQQGTEQASDFNGTGPFIVDFYSVEDRVELVANPDYFLGGLPKIARLEFIFFGDAAAAVAALRGGQVDLAWRMPNVLLLGLEGARGIETFSVATNGFDLVRLRSDRPPGDDPRVIEALKLATDRDAIFELVQLGIGAGGRDSPIGPLYAEYYTEETPLPERDPEAARQLLSDAGYPQGLSLDLYTPDSGSRPDLAVVLKEQWAEAGINVNVIVEPESVYYGEDRWMQADLGITGWGSRPTPQFYLDTMLTCGASWNESRFCDPAFDALAETAGTTLDEDERVEAYAEIQRILIERGPVIVPYFFAQTAAIRDGFGGFELRAFAGRTDFRKVYVE